MLRLVLSLAAATGAAIVTFSSVSAGPASIPVPKEVHILGRESFDPDEVFTITYRFSARHVDVVQGQTVTWDNQTNDAHTISVVAPLDVPETVDQVNNCATCNQIQADHFPSGFPPQGQPVLFLDGFKPGTPPAKFNSPGDSLLMPPRGLGLPLSVSASITAPVGTELQYICAFHPWMQATIRVVSVPDPDAR